MEAVSWGWNVIRCERLAVFYRGVVQGPAGDGRGRLQGMYSMCRNTLLSASLCVEGLISKGLQHFLISGGLCPVFSTLPFDMTG